MSSLSRPAVSVVGLGKLGSSMAAAIASKGFRVIGVDTDERTVALINEGQAPVVEPGLSALITAHRQRLTATTDSRAAVQASAITFLILPTPSEAHGGFSVRHVVQAAERIGEALAGTPGYHLIVLVSTVLPGASRGQIIPALERRSGKRCGADFGVCYSPVFIALGTVIHNYLNPDLLLIGESDERAGSELTTWYQHVCENRPRVARMSLENAELTKLAVNTFVTMKISFANMLAELCEHLPGGDIDVVTAALGSDSRIGAKYLKGALGYGGPCFPRDNRALEHLATELGCRGQQLPKASDAINQAQPERVVGLLRRAARPPARVAVLGLSYKPDTPVVEASQGVLVARCLAKAGYTVTVTDPLALPAARQALGSRVRYAASVGDALIDADAALLATDDRAILAALAQELPQRREPLLLLDCWRVLRASAAYGPQVRIVSLGLGGEADAWPRPAAAAKRRRG